MGLPLILVAIFSTYPQRPAEEIFRYSNERECLAAAAVQNDQVRKKHARHIVFVCQVRT